MRLSRGKDIDIGKNIFTLGLSAGIHASKLTAAKVCAILPYPILLFSTRISSLLHLYVSQSQPSPSCL